MKQSNRRTRGLAEPEHFSTSFACSAVGTTWMATPVELPKLGNTVEECLVTRWIKQKGEAVSAGDVVAEIETDKTTFDVTTPVAGIVLEIFFEEGALVPVFTNLCF